MPLREMTSVPASRTGPWGGIGGIVGIVGIVGTAISAPSHRRARTRRRVASTSPPSSTVTPAQAVPLLVTPSFFITAAPTCSPRPATAAPRPDPPPAPARCRVVILRPRNRALRQERVPPPGGQLGGRDAKVFG